MRFSPRPVKSRGGSSTSIFTLLERLTTPRFLYGNAKAEMYRLVFYKLSRLSFYAIRQNREKRLYRRNPRKSCFR